MASPISPSTATRRALHMSTEISLSSPSRTRPIHPLLPEIKVPSGTLITANTTSPPLSKPEPIPTSHYHPSSCEPLTAEELAHHKFHNLHSQYASDPQGARVALEGAVAEARLRIDESERRRKDIEREMEEKEKTRDFERRIFMKQAGGGTQGRLSGASMAATNVTPSEENRIGQGQFFSEPAATGSALESVAGPSVRDSRQPGVSLRDAEMTG